MQYQKKKIWDPVTRLWHWILVFAISLAWYFGKFMSFTTIEWHFYCGYTVLALMAFRFTWGLVGPTPIRLRSLFYSPKNTITYLRTISKRAPSGTPGHNPLGALSVIAILILVTAQAITGLFVESDVFFDSGPLTHTVSKEIVWNMTWWHKFLSNCVLFIVTLHVSAIFYYWLWKKENLIQPMLTGWKKVRKEEQDSYSD